MSNITHIAQIADRIHFGISYKRAVRTFVRAFRKKYLRYTKLAQAFATHLDFHVIPKA